MFPAPQKVLIHRLGSLGDTAIMLPVFHYMNDIWPQAEKRVMTNFAVGMVGVKVWVLYLPMLYISAAFFSSAEVLRGVLRLCAVLAVISCSLGLTQFVLGQIIGYEQVMTMMYGGAASGATQNFASFNMGAEFFRIPSTFSFPAQYAGFCLVMMPVIYMLQTIETEPRWRTFA